MHNLDFGFIYQWFDIPRMPLSWKRLAGAQRAILGRSMVLV